MSFTQLCNNCMTMEHALRCNTLTCRRELSDEAVVTTCSHIFCLDCANRLQLANQSNRQAPVCPACDQHLVNLDDVVRAKLNPSEDYKTSVLSGLRPNTIMECAGRALNFWAYQTSQEILYQGMQARVLTDRYSKLKGRMDVIIRDANNEMSELRTELNNVIVDLNNSQKRNHELIQAFHAKSKLQAHTQELYDKLKRRDQMSQVQNAASVAVDHTIQGSEIANRYTDHFEKANGQSQSHRSPAFSPLQRNSMPPPPVPMLMSLSNVASRNGPDSEGVSFNGHRNNQGHEVGSTPSSHRQRLNGEASASMNASGMQNSRGGFSTPIQSRNSPSQALLGSIRAHGSSGNGFAGYGMSAGLKVSHTPVGGDGLRNMSRAGTMPRVVHRPSSAMFMSGRSSMYEGAPGLSSGEFY